MTQARRFAVSWIALAAAAATGAAPCQAAVIQSTFDASAENWTTVGDTAAPTWLATGGNPAGHIRATDSVGGITWFFRAPAAFYGDRSASYGGLLSFDMLQADTSAQYDDRDVIMTGGGTTIWYDFTNNPGTTWTHYSAVLDDTGGWLFGAFASPVAATAAQIQTVLSNLSDLQIRGEFRSGADAASLDNAILTPEPSSVVLLGLMTALAAAVPRPRRAAGPSARRTPAPRGVARSS